MKKQRRSAKRKRIDPMRLVCWFVIPAVMAGFLAADALGIYPVTSESLTVLGIWLLVTLLPFISEITVKGLSVKLNKPGSGKDT